MKKLTSFILGIALTMLLTGCQTTKTEYVEVVTVPEISFPIFPLLESAERDILNRTVIVPEEWIIRLEEYHIRIGETEKNYEMIRELYTSKEGENEN